MQLVLLWLNGTFGVGKTTTALTIESASDRWRLFDAEVVGYMLRSYLDGVAFNDFQDLAAWRRLVPSVAKEVSALTGADLLVVQSVLVESYWSELRRGMNDEGLEVFHVLLDCDESVLRERIVRDEEDPGAAGWRLEHLSDYWAARGWMTATADLVVDTSNSDPTAVAQRVLTALAAHPSP
jgi:adenylylsulfate kinase-like enzyme